LNNFGGAIRGVAQPPCPDYPIKMAARCGLKWPATLEEVREFPWRINFDGHVKQIIVPEEHMAVVGLANPDGVLKDGLEYRFEFAWRRTDDAENICRCRLLFQRFGQLTRAPLLGLE
jgi:hypothetical protein